MSDRRAWTIYLPLVLPLIAVGFVLWLVAAENTPLTITKDAKPEDMSLYEIKVRECDRQVPIFMSTHDPVELERARRIIDWFNCSVSRRLRTTNPRD